LSLAFAGDSVATFGNFTARTSGGITGDYSIEVNARPFATVHVTATGLSVVGAGGRNLSAAEQDAAEALLTTAANIALNIEWPTLVIYFCGC
jgi:hypothetical protein